MNASARPDHHRHMAPGSGFTGWAALVRFGLRRDRVRLSIWLAVLTLTMVYTPYALKLAYPEESQRQARVELIKTPAGIMLSGPMFGGNETDLGAMMANELALTLIVATSILAIQTVIRHSRAEEERGAAELVLSSVVGRHAQIAAALTLAGAVTAVLAVTMTIAMASVGFAITDTAAMCVGVTSVAMLFGAFAAVAAQLWRQARTATGASLAALGAAVLVRGAGDVIDNSGSALSWFSPIAWAQQMRPFVALRWWPLALLVITTVVLIGLAAVLQSRREYDDAALSVSGRHRNARPIRGVFGLQLRLQRGQTISWAAALLVSGAVFGSMTKSLLDAAQGNELIARMLAVQGSADVHTAGAYTTGAYTTGAYTTGAYTTMTQFLSAATTAYVVAVIVRLYRDEESGLGEAVLAGSVSRWGWLFSGVAAALTGSGILLLCAGLGNGLGAGLTLGEPMTVFRLTAAALAYLPAMAVIAGIASIGVALRHPSIGWIAVTFIVLSLYLGALLRFPQWLIDISPVSRITAPSSISVIALVGMSAVAVGLTAAAGLIYRNRDAA